MFALEMVLNGWNLAWWCLLYRCGSPDRVSFLRSLHPTSQPSEIYHSQWKAASHKAVQRWKCAESHRFVFILQWILTQHLFFVFVLCVFHQYSFQGSVFDTKLTYDPLQRKWERSMRVSDGIHHNIHTIHHAFVNHLDFTSCVLVN